MIDPDRLWTMVSEWQQQATNSRLVAELWKTMASQRASARIRRHPDVLNSYQILVGSKPWRDCTRRQVEFLLSQLAGACDSNDEFGIVDTEGSYLVYCYIEPRSTRSKTVAELRYIGPNSPPRALTMSSLVIFGR